MASAGLAKNTVWTYADVGGSAISQLIMVRFAAQYLGAGAFGIFALVVSTIAIISGLQFTFGFTVVGAAARVFAGAETGGEREDMAACHTAYCLLGFGGLFLTEVAAAIVAGGGRHAGVSPESVAALIALVGAGTAAGFFSAAPAGIVRGAKDYKRLAISDLIGKLVTLVCVLALLHSVGLVALGIGQLAGQLITAVLLMAWSHRSVPWFALLPAAASRESVRRVLVAGLPLLAISVGSQVVGNTDLITVSVLVGSAATGLYQLGTTLPGRFTTALFQGYDVAFPYLAANTDAAAQERSTRLLTRAFGLFAGLGFGLLSLYRTRLGVALASSHVHATLSDTVMVIFCAILAVNTCYHGLALMVISRGRQAVFTKLTIVEVVFNLGFTVAGVELFGAPGAAYASLLMLGIFNLIVLPALVRDQLGTIRPTFVITDGLGSIAVGVACAALGALVAGALANGLGLGTVVIAGLIGSAAVLSCGLAAFPQARAGALQARQRVRQRRLGASL